MRSVEERKRSEEDAASFRLGSATLGLFGGCVVGLVLAAVFAVGFGGQSYFAPIVFGAAVLGTVAGYLRGSVGFGIAEGAAHFLLGFLVGAAERVVSPLPDAPHWLKAVYWLGLTTGLAFIVRLWW
jgi:hypothetical protein